MGTSPSAVPAKRSAEGEGTEWEGEEEEEEATGSTAKRMRREESHMTGEGFSNSLCLYTYYAMPLAHLIMVYTDCARSTLTG